jgi:hypothetical protein
VRFPEIVEIERAYAHPVPGERPREVVAQRLRDRHRWVDLLARLLVLERERIQVVELCGVDRQAGVRGALVQHLERDAVGPELALGDVASDGVVGFGLF